MKINNKGFTIIELMVATAAFSLVLLIATTTTIAIGKIYYKIQLQSRLQDTVRSVSDDITKTIQFSSSGKINGTNTATQEQVCIGDTRYTYMKNQKVVDSTTLGLRAKRLNAGDACQSPTPDGKELLAKNMRLLVFDINPDATGDSYQISIKVAYGDDELLTKYTDAGVVIPAVNLKDVECKLNIAGSNFCAISGLDNTVKKRLN